MLALPLASNADLLLGVDDENVCALFLLQFVHLFSTLFDGGLRVSQWLQTHTCSPISRGELLFRAPNNTRSWLPERAGVVRSPAGGDIPEIVAEERDPRRRTEDEERLHGGGGPAPLATR